MKPCVYCESQQFENVYQDARLQIVRCCDCGLVRQADYASTLANLNKTFVDPATYYEKRSKEAAAIIQQDTKNLVRTSDIRSYIRQYLKPDSILLDVGSGRGEFAASLRVDSLSVVALEPDAVVAGFAKETFGLDVHVGIYRQSEFPENSFDAITFIQVMEHVEDPLETLSIAYSHLKPGGLLVVDVPGFNNPRILTYRLTGQKRLVQGDFIVSHNHYFTRKTLSLLVEKAGFTLLQALTGRYAVKFGTQRPVLRPLLWTADQVANVMGIGGITLYASK